MLGCELDPRAEAFDRDAVEPGLLARDADRARALAVARADRGADAGDARDVFFIVDGPCAPDRERPTW